MNLEMNSVIEALIPKFFFLEVEWGGGTGSTIIVVFPESTDHYECLSPGLIWTPCIVTVYEDVGGLRCVFQMVNVGRGHLIDQCLVQKGSATFPT